MAGKEVCSFCGKPKIAVGRLFTGPGGVNICDACVAEASKGDSTVGEAGNCSFCGLSSQQVTIMMESFDFAICHSCLERFQEEQGDESEFLSHATHEVSDDTAAELKEQAISFSRNFEQLATSFAAGDIDWTAHNDMAQLLHPMRGKATRIGNEELIDILWNIDQLFAKIHFDDVKANAPAVRELTDLVYRLVALARRAAGS